MGNDDFNTTICAVCTPLSEGAISIIRISGNEAFDIADKIFVNKDHKHLLKGYETHTVHYGFITDIRNIVGNKDSIIDEVLVTVMKAPNTYTREDTVEINCHGGVYVTQSVLEDVLSAGAILAEPGEFTKRAFMNGRIDLTEAEAVMNLISAKNDTAVRNSVKQLRGSVREKVVKLRDDVIGEIAHIEAALDDPEHIELDGYHDHIESVMKNVSCEIKGLIDRADEGRLIQDGINTVIVGKPNVGKSSFMNLMSGHERAIVTDIAGTTRDAIEDTIRIGGVVFNLIDTAGIRDTDNEIEKIGVDLSRKYASDSDLVIYVVDASEPLTHEDDEIIELIKDRKVIVVLNKNDLDRQVSEDDIRNRFSCDNQIGSISLRKFDADDYDVIDYCTDDNDTDMVSGNDIDIISFSAKTGEGTDEFISDVKKMFFGGNLGGGNDVTICSTRQKELLKDAETSIEKVLDSVDKDMPEDFYSIDLRDAYETLGMIIGEEMNDDVVDQIFSRFCMGK
ncbi:MAG: tRNA uridine-5-carboxymethylaminomethyl(34) synthesis GTPase MnmE [Lachnospiraceae bacterium]|jgi:tRNA modification GTPase|nr:tRNA uridine-5-carboxymethylaminomethyl(34) synthesis GTPase MnmE [Lachnospiraceae bacterium]